MLKDIQNLGHADLAVAVYISFQGNAGARKLVFLSLESSRLRPGSEMLLDELIGFIFRPPSRLQRPQGGSISVKTNWLHITEK